MATKTDASEIDQFLPLRPVEFLVLAVLHEEELHGYGIVQEITRRTNERIHVKPGNLYRVLDRLMDRGLLDEAGDKQAAEPSEERRRYYRITKLGRRVARAEATLFGEIAAELR